MVPFPKLFVLSPILLDPSVTSTTPSRVAPETTTTATTSTTASGSTAPRTGGSGGTDDSGNRFDAASSATYLTAADQKYDAMDEFNHPRLRRIIILQALQQKQREWEETPTDLPGSSSLTMTMEQVPLPPPTHSRKVFQDMYGVIHSEGLLDFLWNAWDRWDGLGRDGQDQEGHLHEPNEPESPPLVPCNTVLFRQPEIRRDGDSSSTSFGTAGDGNTVMLCHPHRPSNHVLGQIGYYATDRATPIYLDLQRELVHDAALLHRAVEIVHQTTTTTTTTDLEIPALPTVLVLPTHPGHHAAYDCFGGYCYVNHAVALAKQLVTIPVTSDSTATTNTKMNNKVAILDVDYHCGNGSASLCYHDDTILVVSIHCDPNFDYPFHTGFVEDCTPTTLHIPLPPGTTWDRQYHPALLRALDAIRKFGATTVVVSLGLDTYHHDPCAMRRAGFQLEGDDYVAMGQCIAQELKRRESSSLSSPVQNVLFVQEGGYRMDRIGQAAADVVTSFVKEWNSKN